MPCTIATTIFDAMVTRGGEHCLALYCHPLQRDIHGLADTRRSAKLAASPTSADSCGEIIMGNPIIHIDHTLPRAIVGRFVHQDMCLWGESMNCFNIKLYFVLSEIQCCELRIVNQHPCKIGGS